MVLTRSMGDKSTRAVMHLFHLCSNHRSHALKPFHDINGVSLSERQRKKTSLGRKRGKCYIRSEHSTQHDVSKEVDGGWRFPPLGSRNTYRKGCLSRLQNLEAPLTIRKETSSWKETSCWNPWSTIRKETSFCGQSRPQPITRSQSWKNRATWYKTDEKRKHTYYLLYRNSDQ